MGIRFGDVGTGVGSRMIRKGIYLLGKGAFVAFWLID